MCSPPNPCHNTTFDNFTATDPSLVVFSPVTPPHLPRRSSRVGQPLVTAESHRKNGLERKLVLAATCTRHYFGPRLELDTPSEPPDRLN